MAKKIHGQSLSSAPVSPTCVVLSNPVQPPPGIQDGRTKESIGRTPSQKETLILFIICGQTAGVFGSGWKCSHLLLLLLLLFLVIFHQGHLLADTTCDAVNTMWCEIYSKDTWVMPGLALSALLPMRKNISDDSTQRYLGFLISSLDKYCTWYCRSFHWPSLTQMWVDVNWFNRFNKSPRSLKPQTDFTCFDCDVVLNIHFVVYTFVWHSWRGTSNWENGCIGANYCIVAWLWRRFARRDSHRPQRWWCHRRRLAGGAAGGSFPRRSLFSCIVVEEMSSEQNPVWQPRVKWAEKSKSHPSCEHLIFTVAPLQAGIGS